MKPHSFDPKTAREVVGDSRARVIEAKARSDADAKAYDFPIGDYETYWGGVIVSMEMVVYREQYAKRMARNERKGA